MTDEFNCISRSAFENNTLRVENVKDIEFGDHGSFACRATNDDPILHFPNHSFENKFVKVVMKIDLEGQLKDAHCKLYYTVSGMTKFDEKHCIFKQILRFGTYETYSFKPVDFQHGAITSFRFDPADIPCRIKIQRLSLVSFETKDKKNRRGVESIPDTAVYDLSVTRNAHQRKMGMNGSGYGAPNFFILGAAKCGTTTLYQLLRQHPEIFMPTVKEPTHYCSYFQVISDPVTYHGLFSETDSFRAKGEASHAYFSNPESPKILQLLYPKAKFVLILRNPANRAYSLFHNLCKMGCEKIRDFRTALDVEDTRYSDRKFFVNCPQYFWNFMYKRSGRYEQQWARYLELFSKEQFFLMTLAELQQEPIRWIKQLFAFLGVSEDFTPHIGVLNRGDYDPISPEIRADLDDYFVETVSMIQQMAGRSLDLKTV